MKKLFLLVAALMAITIGSLSAGTSNAAKPVKQRALMEFNHPASLQGVMLKGEYLFVHDDAAMMRGEECTFVYKGNRETPNKLVVSFHCTPAERAKAIGFTVRMDQVSPGVTEIREYQFGGDTEAHLVPRAK